jgi:hypothetical protein
MQQKRRHFIIFDEEDEEFSLSFAPSLLPSLRTNSREWHVLPRSSHWRKEHFLFEKSYLDAQFTNSFRMSRKSFFCLHALLQPHIQKKQTHLRPTIPSEHHLAIFLYHIAQGNRYTSLTDQFGVGKSTVCNIIGDISKAIVQQLSQRYIRFPSIDEAMRSMEFWRDKTGIPGVVGCIDGTHIPIIQPAHSGTAYCNRKGYYSINVQAAVDHRKRFIEATVGWPGSVADGRVFANSFLKSNLEQLLGTLPSTPVATRPSAASRETQHENIPAFILADSAYPSTSRVVPTFKNNECNRDRDIKKLNAKLAGIRYCVENAFGICKGRFRLLNRPLESAKEDVVRTSYLITAIFVLHNFLIDRCDDTPVEVVLARDADGGNDSRLDANDDENNEQGGQEGFPTHNILLRHMYWLNSTR